MMLADVHEIAGGGPGDEPLEDWQYQCCRCERVGKLDHLYEFQRMLGTCDDDRCLEARVAELLACEEQVELLKFVKVGPAMETEYRSSPVPQGEDPFGD